MNPPQEREAGADLLESLAKKTLLLITESRTEEDPMDRLARCVQVLGTLRISPVLRMEIIRLLGEKLLGRVEVGEIRGEAKLCDTWLEVPFSTVSTCPMRRVSARVISGWESEQLPPPADQVKRRKPAAALFAA